MRDTFCEIFTLVQPCIPSIGHRTSSTSSVFIKQAEASYTRTNTNTNTNTNETATATTIQWEHHRAVRNCTIPTSNPISMTLPVKLWPLREHRLAVWVRSSPRQPSRRRQSMSFSSIANLDAPPILRQVSEVHVSYRAVM